MIESLQKFYHYYGNDFQLNGQTLNTIASDLSQRLTNLFLRNEQGQRPVYGNE